MPTIMIQGTTSDAGKSTLVAALCRCLKRRGISVAPFKPQNMALNSAVTPEGGEIGRAQALQAEACGLQPHTDMNPILLKPCTDIGAQVIVHGKAQGNMDARSYHQYKTLAMNAVLESHQRLCERYDVVVVEGAGSPAEINLRDRDIANMGFAEAVDCPVILVADIDRGGVFAHLVGTLELLSESEQARTLGFVINRFRGDIALLESGLDWLEARTQRKVLGVMPYLMDLRLDAEDAISVYDKSEAQESRLKVIVPVLPRISNHTDFDVLQGHPQIDFKFVSVHEAPPPADLVILPGSKAVRADLSALKQAGWDVYLQKHLRYGGKLMGICGGMQMLGKQIHDPQGIEGEPGTSNGFALLDFETTLEAEKVLRNQSGHLNSKIAESVGVSGYEIHAGRTAGLALERPLIVSADSRDGAISEDGQIIGTYWHGLWDQAETAQALLSWAGFENAQTVDLAAQREQALERLADAFEASVDVEQLIAQFIRRDWRQECAQ